MSASGTVKVDGAAAELPVRNAGRLNMRSIDSMHPAMRAWSFAAFPSRLGVALVVVPLACAPVAGCEKQEPKSALNYTADAKRAYDAAMEDFDAHNWPEAQARLREVKRKYAYSKYARMAELRVADADFAQERYPDAIRGYKQYVHDHRSDQEEVSYARSKSAEAQYREIGDALLLPTADERDQGSVAAAYRELRGYVADYPDSKESTKMRELLEDVTARLIRHELYVARFYLQRDVYEAAVSRILFALKSYGGNADALESKGLEPEALVLLGSTYLKLHRWQQAREAFMVVTERYATSALSIQAQKYLTYMKDRGV